MYYLGSNVIYLPTNHGMIDICMYNCTNTYLSSIAYIAYFIEYKLLTHDGSTHILLFSIEISLFDKRSHEWKGTSEFLLQWNSLLHTLYEIDIGKNVT